MRSVRPPFALLTATALLLPAAAAAQEPFTLPEICTAGAGHAMHTVEETPHAGAMAPAHEALMAGMDEMNALMMQGMSASDFDIAFVCGMIPHHQGAIAMAKAELAHGDNEWARDMAQRIIESQEQEIAEMLAWLEEQMAE